MQMITSKDGTTIAYDREGDGPAAILVAGALCARLSWSGPAIAALLAPHFTVYNYDRRGRGDSGDTMPYAVAREIEDIEALIDDAGGSAYLFGHSSGAALALEAAAALGRKVARLAMYDAPYDDDREAPQRGREYTRRLSELLAADRRGDAVVLFMALVGTPAEQIEGMRRAPFWPALEAIAPTLAYDNAVISGEDGALPIARAAQMTAPTLVMAGGASHPSMQDTARTLSAAMPHARLRTLAGQGHEVSPEALAPVLIEFFRA